MAIGPTGICKRGEDATLLMVLNAPEGLVRFAPPETTGGSEWTLVMDTNLADHANTCGFATGDAYEVTRRSLLLLA
jgi:glycogen operon protein